MCSVSVESEMAREGGSVTCEVESSERVESRVGVGRVRLGWAGWIKRWSRCFLSFTKSRKKKEKSKKEKKGKEKPAMQSGRSFVCVSAFWAGPCLGSMMMATTVFFLFCLGYPHTLSGVELS